MSKVYSKKNSPYYHYDFVVDGRRFSGSTKETGKYFAQRFENNLRAKVSEKGPEAGVHRKIPTLVEFSVEFLKWVGESHSIEHGTKAYYANGWRLLKTTQLAEMKMEAITNHDCETITFPGSNYNANNALSTLRRMIGKAKELKRISEPPKIKLRKVWGRSVAMSAADAEKIALHMLDGDAQDAFLILRETGMRPMECFSLRWEHVQWEGRYRNPSGKTRTARRIIPLLGQALPILKQRHVAAGAPGDGWVFPAKKSATGHMMTIAKSFTKARDAAGLPKAMCLYTARHGFGSDVGPLLGLKGTMEIMGHSDSRTALGYQHVELGELQAKLDAAKTNGRVM